MDMLRAGLAWLDSKRHGFMAETVTYQRGAVALELTATVGKTGFELEDEAGAILRAEVRDFLVRLVDLGPLGLPQPGDTIRVSRDGQIAVYEAMNLGEEGCWRWSDPYEMTMRIHSRRIGTEPI